MLDEFDLLELSNLTEAGVVNDADKNLRSKIDSILRSIENLTAKKLRLEFEIKKQKKSLIRKREELKKQTSSTRKKITLKLESGAPVEEIPSNEEIQKLRRIDSKLLQESSFVIDEL